MADTIAVEPGFAAVDVTHIDEVSERRILRSAVTADYQHMFGRDGDGNRVVERSQRGISSPVDGVDADAGSGNNGLDKLYVLDGVVTDGDVRICLALRRTDMRTERVLRSELIAHDISGYQTIESLIAHVCE